MSRDPRDTREETARREIGRTRVSAALARTLVALFALTAAVVPVAELASGDGWRGVPGVGATLGEAWAAARVEGPLAGNRALLARMDALEDRLDEESLVAAAVLPPVQWLLTAVLGVGNEQAYAGRGGWLFFAPGVRYLTGPGFLEPEVLARRAAGGDAWEEPPQPDPRRAIVAFARRLAADGIELVVVPTPVKGQLEASRLAARAAGADLPLANPSFQGFVDALAAEGVGVFDPAPLLARAREESGEAQFLAADTHWTPAAMEVAARGLADWVAERVQLPPAPPVSYRRQPVEVEGRGDLRRMLRLPAWAGLYPPQRVEVQRVLTAGGRPWRPDPQADVLVLGDSFTNVFSLPALGWGEGGGLAEQLSFFLRRPVDRIAVNAGGAYSARQRLAEARARGEDRLAGKRLVIYQFAARELAVGDWKLLEAGAPAAGPTHGAPGPTAGEEGLGEGFVVWESNRTGEWRIWRRRLDGSGLVQLSGDEPGMHHCCPHISPDGRWVVYLSRKVGGDHYPEVEEAGTLRLLAADGGEERTLGAARTYGYGNRAAVWRDGGELTYVDGVGHTALLDVETGVSRRLTRTPREKLAWLVDATLTHAVNAASNFSLYDRERREVIEREPLPGCEGYFSHDGRWGFWNAAAGGPIRRIDLGDREMGTLLERGDPRLPADRGYLYFAMLSRDGRVLAFGASSGPEQHDHFTSDYDLFAVRTDPRTLEIVGTPVRLTSHPATDRYPDVFPAPLELGYHAGEAPLAVELQPPAGGGRLRWDWGDGAREVAAVGRHTYRAPGRYQVVAEGGGERYTSEVAVEPARPPRALSAALTGDGRGILVRFDEEVDLAAARLSLVSGQEIHRWHPGADGRSLRIELAAELPAADRLQLAGVRDRAAEPNLMPATTLEIEPPPWPSRREGLLFAWEAHGRPNLAYNPRLEQEQAYPLTARGRARFDRKEAMVLTDGAFAAPAEVGEHLHAGVQKGWAISVEATLTPAVAATRELAPTIAFSDGPGASNFVLGQEGEWLVLSVLTGPEGYPAPTRARLFPLAADRTDHVVVTYAPGRLRVYRDGEPVPDGGADAGPGGGTVRRGFARWRPRALAFGARGEGVEGWPGTLEGVALYTRVLTPEEVGENHRRLQRLRAGRGGEVERLEVEARLVARSAIPTLRQITPYRRALAVYEYEVESVLAGNTAARRLRVAHWVILDAERQAVAAAPVGQRRRLLLEPFAANPQLEAHFLSDTLPPRPGLPLYYAVEP